MRFERLGAGLAAAAAGVLVVAGCSARHALAPGRAWARAAWAGST